MASKLSMTPPSDQRVVSPWHDADTPAFADCGSTDRASASGVKTKMSNLRRCKQLCESIRKGSSSSLTSVDWYSRCGATK